MTWPFPNNPQPWTPEQLREYERQQREKLPPAPMADGLMLPPST